MRTHAFRIAVIGLTSFALLRYLLAEGRPGREEVLKEFTTQHPERIVEKVAITEDEVIARSFAFTYRVPSDSQIRQEEWHYVENHEGIWTRTVAPAP